MTDIETLETIKTRGYWRINFEPLVYDKEKLKTLGDCKDIVEKENVVLRGWNYPHFPRRVGDDAGLETGANYYEGWIAWWNHIELWRMYQSGQFIHYVALRDDWSEKDGWGIVEDRNIPTGTELNVIGELIYELTEIYEFLARLTKRGLYDEGVRVSISLNNTENRTLVLRDPMRFGLRDEYTTRLKNIPFEKEYSKEEILTNSKGLAFEAILYILERFGWHNPPIEVFQNDQENLLNRRL